MGLLRFRRGGGGVKLPIVDCPSNFGITFSGKLVTGRGEREFRGLLLDGLEYLWSTWVILLIIALVVIIWVLVMMPLVMWLLMVSTSSWAILAAVI